jgi:cyclophilin family peptidyl-prolyl cis-trans isomerase
MKKFLIVLLSALVLVVAACSHAQDNTKRKRVLISTNYGDITIELYNETPQHRDNFIKLAKQGYFNGLLFHRVIKNFMIQGGDPNSRNAPAGQRLGSGGPGYQIPAEIKPELFHKKGALAAARQGDQVNPERKSSGSQFYIVQGQVYTNGQLDTLEMQMNSGLQQQLLQKYAKESTDELNKFRQAGDQDGFNKLVTKIRAKADSAFQKEKITIPEEHRKVYTTIGGTPSLDGAYTVFGEVVKGMDVIDKIADVKTDQNDRPVKDVVMKVEVLN